MFLFHTAKIRISQFSRGGGGG